MLNLQFLLVIATSLFSVMGTLAADEPPPPPAAPSTEDAASPQPSITTFEEAAPISYEGAFTKMLLTLAALIILIFLTVWVLRKVSQGRFGGGAPGGRAIKILERRALSPKSVLYLLEIGGKKVVIAESQLEVRRIATLDQLSTLDE